mmetsp:Transcript_23963/g.26613  ORF Transcript_23963/g.26613 Transcript_23963/m.26613 type:complete len:86 (-) Transcript_23963:57-314(-)
MILIPVLQGLSVFIVYFARLAVAKDIEMHMLKDQDNDIHNGNMYPNQVNALEGQQQQNINGRLLGEENRDPRSVHDGRRNENNMV